MEEKRVRIIEARRIPVMADGKPTGITETYVENDWHCPRMAEGEIVENPGDGLIFQGMPTEPCAIFDKDGNIEPASEINTWGDTCRFYCGEFQFGSVDRRTETGRKQQLFVKCSNDCSFNLDKVDLYLYRVEESFRDDPITRLYRQMEDK